jgi:hypothetical protein
MHDIYSGQVKMIRGSYGFIDRNTLRNVTTGDMDLRHETDQDIFFPTKDFPDARVYTGELKFHVVADQKRGQGTFRAVSIQWASIELHFPDRIIDHPTAAVRWCLSAEARQLVAESKDTTWYLAIVAQPRRGSRETSYSHRPGTTFSTWIGLKRIGDGHGFINFSRSGLHDVVAYLVASQSSEKSRKKYFARYDRPDKIDVWEDPEETILATGKNDLPFLENGTPDQVRGLAHAIIDIPQEIFAKPLSPHLKQWLTYFDGDRPEDECNMRRNVILACTLGPFAFVLWEFVKRLWMLLLGLFHLYLAGGSPLPLWRRAFTSNLSAKISNWNGEFEYEPLTDWTDNKLWFHPLPWTILTAVLAWFMLAPEGKRSWPIAILCVFFAVITVIGLLTLFGNGISTFLEQFVNDQTYKRKQSILNRIELYASCDLKRTEEVAPPKTVYLVWSGIKRRVCRTYAN